jgi:hypothetical protein
MPCPQCTPLRTENLKIPSGRLLALQEIGKDYLLRFAHLRLLGDHVPYCVEAFPEQNQSHLSAESGLYCRIFTEGVCGIRPTGFNAFTAIPRIPKSWPGVKLTKIRAFART